MKISSKRWKQLAGIPLKESRALGTDDSVDGSYTEVSPLQPMDQNPRELQEEEEYPQTASEYAEKLNGEHKGLMKLVSDQDHWDKANVHTGEDLARYLAISSYSDAYKDSYGIRPKHMKFDNLSISQIDKMTDDIVKDNSGIYDDDDYRTGMSYYDYPEDEYEDEYPVEFDDAANDPPRDKYSDLEDELDDKYYGRSF